MGCHSMYDIVLVWNLDEPLETPVAVASHRRVWLVDKPCNKIATPAAKSLFAVGGRPLRESQGKGESACLHWRLDSRARPQSRLLSPEETTSQASTTNEHNSCAMPDMGRPGAVRRWVGRPSLLPLPRD